MQKRFQTLVLAFESNPAYEFLLLAAITAVAALLRFYKLGEWSFWGDEIFTLGSKQDGFNFNIFRQSLAASLIQLTTASLGTSEWSARLVPAVIGTFSIPILYFPVQRQFGTVVAIIAGLLLAVSPWHIYWSQNARFYILLFLFYSAGLLFFYTGLEEDNPWFIGAALVFFGLAARERLLALLSVPVILAYLSVLKILPVQKPAGFRPFNLAIFFVPGAVFALLFTAPYLRNIPEWVNAFGRINNNPFWLTAGVVYYVGLPVIVTGLVGAIYLLSKGDRGALFFSLSAAIPLLAMITLSLFQYTANRYVFITLFGWILLAALAVKALYAQLAGSARFFALGMVVLLFVSSLSEDILYFQFQNGNRDRGREAFAYIVERKQPGDLVVAASPEVGKYYLGEGVLGYQNFKPEDVSMHERIWFIEDLTVAERFPRQYAWLRQNAREVANFDVHAHARLFTMRVYLYEKGVIDLH